jgi:hypothetical protein
MLNNLMMNFQHVTLSSGGAIVTITKTRRKIVFFCEINMKSISHVVKI